MSVGCLTVSCVSGPSRPLETPVVTKVRKPLFSYVQHHTHTRRVSKMATNGNATSTPDIRLAIPTVWEAESRHWVEVPQKVNSDGVAHRRASYRSS